MPIKPEFTAQSIVFYRSRPHRKIKAAYIFLSIWGIRFSAQDSPRPSAGLARREGLERYGGCVPCHICVQSSIRHMLHIAGRFCFLRRHPTAQSFPALAKPGSERCAAISSANLNVSNRPVAVLATRRQASGLTASASASLAFAVMGLFAGAGAMRSFAASFALTKRSFRVGTYYS